MNAIKSSSAARVVDARAPLEWTQAKCAKVLPEIADVVRLAQGLIVHRSESQAHILGFALGGNTGTLQRSSPGWLVIASCKCPC